MSNLTPAEIERLNLLIEESAEVIQAAAKVLRFGWSGVNFTEVKDYTYDNKVALEAELGDIRAAIALMDKANDISYRTVCAGHALNKLSRMKEFLRQEDNVALANEVLHDNRS